jgi:hypothetical protein
MGRWEGGELKTHRWSSLVQVLKALLLREDAIRIAWEKDLFGDIGTTNIIDTAISSEMFWKYARFVLHVAGAVDVGSSYCEGCACHEHEQIKHNAHHMRRNEIEKRLRAAIGAETGGTLPYPASCPLKNRRAPELASGSFAQFIRDTMQVTRDVIDGDFRERLGSAEWTTILQDWSTARDTCLCLVGQLPPCEKQT